MAMSFDFKRYFVLICLGISVLGNIFLWLFLVFKANNLGEEAILHYDVAQGIDQIGPAKSLFVLPLMGLVIIGFNFFLSAWGIKQNRLMAQILGGLAVATQIILIVAALLIVQANTLYV